MQRMIGESAIDFGSETYKRGIEQYTTNMTAIIKEIQGAQVPVIIGTLAANLKDQKPFTANW